MPRLYEEPETYEPEFEYFDELEQADFEAGDNGEFEDSEFEEPATEFEEEFEEEGEFSPAYVHPQLGIGRPVEQEFEWEEQEEEIIGKGDSRSPVKNTKRAPCRWICRLSMIYQNPSLWGGKAMEFVGTGLLISPRHVLTAAHNLRNQFNGTTLDARSCTVAPGQDRSDRPFGIAAMDRFHIRDEWRNNRNPCHDFALITLRSEIGNVKFKSLGNKQLGHWGASDQTYIEVISPDKLRKRTAHVVGYPGDKCGYLPMEKHVRGASCQYVPKGKPSKSLVDCLKKGLMATAQFGDKGKIVAAEAANASPFLLYDMDTCQGHSGSPVWVTSGTKRYLVGVHTGPFASGKGTCTDVVPAGETIDTNRAVRLSAKVLDDIRKWMRA
jgi:V8-like Glu-specific endopeptidase